MVSVRIDVQKPWNCETSIRDWGFPKKKKPDLSDYYFIENKEWFEIFLDK